MEKEKAELERQKREERIAKEAAELEKRAIHQSYQKIKKEEQVFLKKRTDIDQKIYIQLKSLVGKDSANTILHAVKENKINNLRIIYDN